MPPEQTNFPSETGRDAAGLRLAVAIEDDTGDALAEAAGPPVAATPSVLSLLQEYWRAFRKRRQRWRPCVSLHELSDRDLKDIGLTPPDIDYIMARRAFERLRDDRAYLWHS